MYNTLYTPPYNTVSTYSVYSVEFNIHCIIKTGAHLITNKRRATALHPNLLYCTVLYLTALHCSVVH